MMCPAPLFNATKITRLLRMQRLLARLQAKHHWERSTTSLYYIFCKTVLAGRIIALETDTVPGLAVDVLSLSALARLYCLKKRAAAKPIVWLISEIKPLLPYIEYSPLARRLVEKYWPGALTIVFNLTPAGSQALKTNLFPPAQHLATQSPAPTPNYTSQAQLKISHNPKNNEIFPTIKTIALRMPADPFILTALQLLGTPLAVTSANYSDEPPPKTLAEVRKLFATQIDVYLERGRTMSNHASTIVDISTGTAIIKRQGTLKL
ncbi:putative threonylcarbamoyl-AMP synthase [Spirochaetota bacterium]|nr:putative threonylcarbamoyl-AMP synthase [Spirochaetota bacterium]